MRVDGLERLPAQGPVILAINHLSMLDPILIGALVPRVVHFMAKEELFRYPLLAPVLRWVHAFPVRRGQPDREALARALAILRRGEVVGIFPEGTRGVEGRLLPLQAGTAFLALKSGAVVVPVAIVGTHRAMPRGAWWPRRVGVLVRIGEPLPVAAGQVREGGLRRAELQQLSARIHHALHRLVTQLLSEAPGTP
ncbi:MAG TPA: lysophospholipid acyltransferase family protein [Limnochordales bacterium]